MTRRYRVLGGVFLLMVPGGGGGALLLVGMAGDLVDLVLVAALVLAVAEVERGQVLEITPHGLSREVRIAGALVYPVCAMAWPAVEEIHTRWREPGDDTVLETIVSGAGPSIRFTSNMGYRAFRGLVEDVVARAPSALRTGLTDQLLSEPAPAGPWWHGLARRGTGPSA
jgi:hypothetical protein